MTNSNRPLSEIMIKKLRDCYEKQSKNGSLPCMEEDLKGSLAALYKRGLVDTRLQNVNGKQLLSVVVTDAGIKFLESLDK